MELHRRLDLGKRRLQAVQVPAGLQPLPEHLRSGADRFRSVHRCEISYEGTQHFT